MARKAKKTGRADALRLICFLLARYSSLFRASCSAERGGAGDTGFFAVARQNKRYLLRPGIQHRAFPLAANFVQVSSKHAGHTSAQDNDVRLEKIDDIAEPVGEQVNCFADDLDGDRIFF